MAKPWEKYGGSAQPAATAKPWERYGAPPPAAAPMAQPSAEFPNPQGISDLARRGFGRGGRAPDEATRRAMMDNTLTRTVEGAIDDPMGTLNAIPAGFNRGVTNLVGLPVDTVTSAVDLLGMAYGATRSLISGKPASEFYEPQDRANTFGTGENLAGYLDKGTTAIGAGPVTQNPSPNNPAARLTYAAGAGIPGALTARTMLAGGAGGATSQVVAEAGGDPAAQAAAGLLGGRVAERVPASIPAPQRAPAQTTPEGGFLPDSGGAAAAMPPQLQKVPRDLRGPIVEALMRGDRDLATAVIDAETLPVPVRMLEGQARGDAKLISDELNLRATDERVVQALQEQNVALVDNLDTIRREVAPNVVGNDHVQNGQAIIDSYKAYDEPVRAEITAAYKALEDANGGQLPINAKAFVDAANAALTAKLKTRYLPAQVRGDLDAIAEDGGMMTFEQYENLRTNLATAARDADRGTLGGGGNAAAAIRLVRDALEDMPMAGDAATNIKALADRARQLSRERFERIRKDPAYEAAVDDPTPLGELSPFADEFVRKFVVNGKAANLAKMRENLAADPIAGETIAAAALNYVKKRTGVDLYTNEGNFSQAGFNRALAELTPRLSALMPENAAELLQQLGRVARRVQQRPKGSYVNESNTLVAGLGEAVKANVEQGLNTVVPGANMGTFIRKKRAEGRGKKRAERALDPRKYLTQDNEE